uniref:Uncharacterized protein n=1 Tax=Mus musculus TaxID=10090 RepID=Q8BJ77_MOUSE|nr:unnamed protein product [Mus musculus]
MNYCYNNGHCDISEAPGCQPTCTCPTAFTDNRCFLAGNSFTPTISMELPLRTIVLSLREDENASAADLNASVANILENLDMRAFFSNSLVELIQNLSRSTALEQVHSSLEGHLPLPVPSQGPAHPLSEQPADTRRDGALPPSGSAGDAEEEWRSQEGRPLLRHLEGRSREPDGSEPKYAGGVLHM